MENYKEISKGIILRILFGTILFGTPDYIQAGDIYSLHKQDSAQIKQQTKDLPPDSSSHKITTLVTKKIPKLDPPEISPRIDEPETPMTPPGPNKPPTNPSSPNNRYSVGSPQDNFTVTNTGAAVYSIKIDIPNGGPFTPQISLSYNSQTAGYGLAGYGININGISVITRGGKDMFHDGQVKGVSYTTTDNFFLDGKRLIYQSGNPGQEGAIYTVEGEPFTKVIAHGVYDNNTANTWFEVRTNTGMTYQYGNSTDSRVYYKNKKEFARIASWYINRAEDKYKNFITYTYAVSYLNIRPLYIMYGMNDAMGRGFANTIEFSYQSLGANARTFTIEDQQSQIDTRLSSIKTYSSRQMVYRKYLFTYDEKSDQSQKKYSRLVKIEEQNGHGESLAPIYINWTFLPEPQAHVSQLNVRTKDDRSYVEEGEKSFFSADLNGDGVSDIVRIAPVKITDYSGYGTTHFHYETYVYISRSKVSSSGNISYEEPLIFSVPASFSMGSLISTIGGTSAMDFDGDGYNDLIIPYYNQGEGYWKEERFYLIFGSDIAAGRSDMTKEFAIPLQATNRTPFFATFDTDGNGKDDVICVEQRQKDGYYPCSIVKLGEGTKLDRTELKLRLAKDPDNMFTGDFNNDGLSDLILVYEGGYKIYFNNGGSAASAKFTEPNSKSGTDFGNYWRMQQGDFNGDGLLDFVYNKSGESCLWIAYNNGDGTFSYKQTEDIGISNHHTNKDDDKFSIMAWDIDHDGLSDVMVCKAGYRHRGFLRCRNDYTNTQVRWLVSTGSTLKQIHSYTKGREDDALEGKIFLGDFDGDGYPELANYGSVLNSTDDSFNEGINVYKAGYDFSQSGKITSIYNGMESCKQIQYAYTTNPLVYKQTAAKTYPVNTYTLPLSVVLQVNSDNGAAGWQTTKYFYEDMKLHIAGRGILGFSSVTKENTTLDAKESTSITQWDEKRWIPTIVKETNSIGNASSTVTSTYTIETIGKNYFAYISQKEITDLDGNTATTITHYDTSKGVITDETVKTDGDNMYKKVSYSGYQNKAGVWLPTTLTMTQKHADDAKPYTTRTTYSYDDKGNVLSTTINDGTPMALKTTSTYDVFGNVCSSVSTGNGVKPVTHYYYYELSGRFIDWTYTKPASTVKTFTYDTWGNLLTENDITNYSSPLVTKYTYDNWGTKTSSQTADGTETTYSIGWGPDKFKKYYVAESTVGKPFVRIWYDNAGHEVLRETKGAGGRPITEADQEEDNEMAIVDPDPETGDHPLHYTGIPITKSTTYNNKGEISRIENKVGKLTITQTLTYDERGRVLTDILSSGKSTSYSYGNRSVTSTVAGRSYTKITDAWGNVIKSIDPAGEINYVYSSIGKPSSIHTHGSTIQMTYDVAGNQTSLIDPDAGMSTYTYAADGTLLKQTDGRGVETVNTYDDLGRLVTVKSGQNTITNTYGIFNRERVRLLKQTMGNNSVEYTYDKFDRVIAEKRNVEGKGTYDFSYEYNDRNQLAKIHYPGGLEVAYKYDYDGFKVKTTAGNHVVYEVENSDGLVGNYSFMEKLTTTRTHDAQGYERNRQIIHKRWKPSPEAPKKGVGRNQKILCGIDTLENFDESYDRTTDNLLSRKRNSNTEETFGYDNLDRLISVKTGETETMIISYAPNGNILFKTGVGNYSYQENNKPHAVTEVENTDGKISSDALNTSFNDFGKIQLIEDTGKNLRMDLSYGPDQERWYSELSKNGTELRTTVYAGEYEKVTENGTTREFYYLDGNTIVIKENNGAFKPYLAFTDNLGNILSVVDENGTKVFEASYDAWGKQTVMLNTIGLHRGYTGHEMLSEFDIINMNGRLYDPVLGRFFSPDNYVQMPDNSQNFNRYSYCLNNPLKYTDPSGELFGIDDAVIAFAVFNVASSMMQASFEGKSVWKAGALSLLSSAATYGIGEAFKGTAMTFGNELLRAGAHGLSSAVFTAIDGGNFVSGFASGALASCIGSYAQCVNMNSGLMIASTTAMGGAVAWATGGDFLQGAIQGLSIGLLNHQAHEKKLYDRQLKKIYKAYLKTSWRVKDGYWEIVPVNEFCENIGGELLAIKDEIQNSCAIRVSAALNAAGYNIPNIDGTMEGKDGKGYFLKAKDLNKYLSSSISPVKLTNVISNPNHAKNGLIYIYPGTAWQSQRITGHVDVVYRGVWASHTYYADYYGGSPYEYKYRSNVFH